MRFFAITIFAFALFALAPMTLAQTGAPASQTGDNAGKAPAQITDPSYGQKPPQGTNVTLINPLKGSGDLQKFLLNILDFVIRIGTVVVILMLVYVGYLFVAAQGKEDKIREARQALLYTLVGALILLGSKAIAFGIEATVQALSVGK